MDLASAAIGILIGGALAFLALAARRWLFVRRSETKVSTPRQPRAHPSMRAFREWTTLFMSIDDEAERKRLLVVGVELARRRALHVEALIRTDPAHAVAAAFPSELRARLPVAVREHVEEPVKGRGSLECRIACDPAGGRTRALLDASIAGRSFVAFAPASRRASVRDAALEGVALGSFLALGSVTDGAEDGEQHVAVPQSLLPAAPGLPPRRSAVGTLRCLVIRARFTDDAPGYEPVSMADASETMAATDEYFRAWSRGRLSLAWDVTEVYPLGRARSSYAFAITGNPEYELHAEARTLAQEHWQLSGYDRVLVVFREIQVLINPHTGRFEYATWFQWIASANRPNPGEPQGRHVWLNGWRSAGVIAHELGHTFGLHHANRLEVPGQRVVGEGTSVDYGDLFDTMGGNRQAAHDIRHCFNPPYLYMIGWRDPDEVVLVDAPGDYTVRRFDHPQSSGSQALVVSRDPAYYWIGLRGNFTDNPDLSSGAYVVWFERGGTESSQLLDFSPATGSFNDAALDVGMPFADTAYGITLEVIESAGAGADAYLTVRVGFPELPPTIVEQPRSISAAAGSTPQLRVVAAGSRPLQYEWRRDGAPVDFAGDSPILAFPPLVGAHAGSYSVIVSNEFGQVESAAALLTVMYPPPALVRRSRYRNVRLERAQVSFSVEIESDLPVTYAWTHEVLNRTDTSERIVSELGAQGPSLALDNLEFGHAGLYVCVATTASGSVRVPFLLKIFPAYLTVSGFGSADRGALDCPHNIGGVVEVGAGDQYSVALRHDGTLVAWGAGPSTAGLAMLDDVTAIAIGRLHSWALRADGTVWEWSEFIQPRQVAGLANVISVAVNGGNWMALTGEGRVEFRHLGSLPSYPLTELVNVADISAGEFHGAVLLNDGSVRVWGLSTTLHPSDATLTDAVSVACGDTHVAVLKADGTVVGVGAVDASRPALVLQQGWLWAAEELASGARHGLAIYRQPSDDLGFANLEFRYKVAAWGANDAGQGVPLSWTRPYGIAGGVRHSLVIVPFLRG